MEQQAGRTEVARWQVVGGKRQVILYHDAPFPTIRNIMDKGPYTQRTITDSYGYEEFAGNVSAGAAGNFYAPNDEAAVAHMEAHFVKQFRSEYRSVKLTTALSPKGQENWQQDTTKRKLNTVKRGPQAPRLTR